MPYMHRLMSTEEEIVHNDLPEKFAYEFDWYSVGNTQYVGVPSMFPADNVVGYKKVLLRLSPMENEDSVQTGDPYI